jgi:hypothetical protein
VKPLSVTLPFAARFTEGEAASRARERMNNSGERKNRDSGWKGRRETAGAVFDVTANYRLAVGPVSSEWWE